VETGSKAIVGIMTTLILFAGFVSVFNMKAVVAESIPTTEILYDWISGYSFPTPGVYVIATEINPVKMRQNYTIVNDYYKMLKEHVTTEANVEDFISILVSRGMFSTGGYGLEIRSIEKMNYAFVLSADFTDPPPGAILIQVITNPTALIPIGNLPAGEYSVTLYIDRYLGHEYMGTETWTATFKCSAGWITVKSHSVEMSIENKTTALGEEISIFMMAPMGTVSGSSQIFDIFLYDSNYSLFSFWSQDKVFLCVITAVGPGYNATLRWNLYRYDGRNYFPPHPGDYYLVGAVKGIGTWDVTPSILLRIDNSTITPIGPVSLPVFATVDFEPYGLGFRSSDEWVTAHIEPYEGYDVSDARARAGYDVRDIDVSSLKLNDTISVDLNAPTEIGDYDNDTIPDLTVKFNWTELIPYIYHVLGIKYGNVTLTVTGELFDGTPFEGSDTIWVNFAGDICGMYEGIILPIPDGVVDLDDFMIIAMPGHIFARDPTWDPVWGPTCDINRDGKVGVFDLIITGLNFGATAPPQ